LVFKIQQAARKKMSKKNRENNRKKQVKTKRGLRKKTRKINGPIKEHEGNYM
jgi:hypothetical protein